MTPASRARIEAWWCALMSTDPAQLWASVTVRPHTLLGDYVGLYVVWRGDGLHVSAPTGDLDVAALLAGRDLASLQHLDTWSGVADARGWQVVGPATHTYLDVDPGMPSDVERVSIDDLVTLKDAVSDAEWTESGWDDDPSVVLAVRDGDDVVAAANLNRWVSARDTRSTG